MTNPFHPEIELNIETTVIRAQRRKLKATWTMDVEIVQPDPATIEALARIVLERYRGKHDPRVLDEEYLDEWIKEGF